MVKVRGFSMYMSLPDLAAAIPGNTCQWSSVEITTASMSSRAMSSRKSLYAAQPLYEPLGMRFV